MSDESLPGNASDFGMRNLSPQNTDRRAAILNWGNRAATEFRFDSPLKTFTGQDEALFDPDVIDEIVPALSRGITKEHGFVTREQIIGGTLRALLADGEVLLALPDFQRRQAAAFEGILEFMKLQAAEIGGLKAKLAEIEDKLAHKSVAPPKLDVASEVEENQKATIKGVAAMSEQITWLTEAVIAAKPATVPVQPVDLAKTFSEVLKANKKKAAEVKAEKSALRAKKAKEAKAAEAKAIAAKASRRAAVLAGEAVYTPEQDAVFKAKIERRGLKFIPLAERVEDDGFVKVTRKSPKQKVSKSKFSPEQTARFIQENFTAKGRKYYTLAERQAYQAKLKSQKK